MERKPVKSSNVASVGYDPDSKILEVEFKSGGIYQYSSVEPNIHASLMSAESIGKFVNQNVVRGGFKGQRMDSKGESAEKTDHIRNVYTEKEQPKDMGKEG